MANRSDGPRVIKKYSNRRLYDTRASAYITLDELTARVREGDEVSVLDAQSHEDLTQATLTQIIIEGRGAARLLPVPLLTQLIRMGDEALAEFLGRYMAAALELYLRARSSAQTLGQYNPLATMPFTAADALARLMLSPASWLAQGPLGFAAPTPAPQAPAPPEPPPEPPSGPPPCAPAQSDAEAVAELRREVEALRRSLKKTPKTTKTTKPPKTKKPPRKRAAE